MDDVDNEVGADILLGSFDTNIVGVQHYVSTSSLPICLLPPALSAFAVSMVAAGLVNTV